VSPARSSASEDTILKVDPGAARPVVAIAPVAVGLLAAATTSPVEGRIATRVAGTVDPARASSAASWASRSRVTVSDLPGIGSCEKSVRETAVPLLVPVALIFMPGVPAR
jgi:hypothetical protein